VSAEETERRIAEAERSGYVFETRHQPQADLEEPDWVVVIHTPDGRLLFPGAVDNEQEAARRRAATAAERDQATHPSVHHG
jgi:hypothetical protein